MYVSFTEKSMKVIEGIFPNPQPDEVIYPHQGEIEEDDPRYLDYVESTTLNQRQRAELKRDELLQVAAIRIAPLQDAIEVGMSTPEMISRLTAWKKYRIALSEIEIGASNVDWPETPS